MVERGHRRREVGLVVGDGADKTISVDVRRLVKHPKYGKYVYRTTRCYAHDEEGRPCGNRGDAAAQQDEAVAARERDRAGVRAGSCVSWRA